MAYRIAPFPITFTDFQAHSSISSLSHAFFVHLCSSWQDFNGRSTSRVPSVRLQQLSSL